MERETALKLFSIYQIQKELGRAIYPEDLVNRQVLSKSSAPHVLEDFYFKNLLVRDAEQGANVYKLSWAGISGMNSYRDLKLQIEA